MQREPCRRGRAPSVHREWFPLQWRFRKCLRGVLKRTVCCHLSAHRRGHHGARHLRSRQREAFLDGPLRLAAECRHSEASEGSLDALPSTSIQLQRPKRQELPPRGLFFSSRSLSQGLLLVSKGPRGRHRCPAPQRECYEHFTPGIDGLKQPARRLLDEPRGCNTPKNFCTNPLTLYLGTGFRMGL
jgi:hypothetical protein